MSVVYTKFDDTALPDYKDNAEFYEIEEKSRPDEMAMVNRGGELGRRFLDKKPGARVLDLCCGTGLSLSPVVDHKNISYACGVDISEAYLDFASTVFKQKGVNVNLIHGDAIETKLPFDQWDLIILDSAYHHIEDYRKELFLAHVAKHLKQDGVAIFAENILPEYDIETRDDYSLSVKKFYSSVIDTAKKENPNLPEHVEQLIKKVAQYGFDGDYEYKVCYSVFKRHLLNANLCVVSEEKVWPTEGPLLSTTAGNYVVVVKKTSV